MIRCLPGWVGVAVFALAPVLDATPLERGREALRLMLFDDAASHFREAQKQAQPSPAEADVGLALALIGRHPRSDVHLREALALLQRVVGQSKVPAALRAFAAYQAARVETRWGKRQGQSGPHPLERVADDFGGEFFGQQALVKLTLLESYAPDVARSDPERLRAFEARVERLTDPMTRRDFHTTLGHAALYLEADEGLAYRHLEQAHLLGTGASFRQRSFLIRLGEVAFRQGRRAEARAWYQAYLNAFPRDGRRQWIEDRLRQMEAEEASSK